MNVIREFEGVAKVVRVSEPFRLASRHFRKASTVISGEWGTIGGNRPWIAIEPVGLDAGDGEEKAGGRAGDLGRRRGPFGSDARRVDLARVRHGVGGRSRERVASRRRRIAPGGEEDAAAHRVLRWHVERAARERRVGVGEADERGAVAAPLDLAGGEAGPEAHGGEAE